MDELAYEPSVLHLAAAAEEILEALLKRENKGTVNQFLLEGFQKNLTPTLDRKTFYQEVSRTKNAVKHADVAGEDMVEIPLGQGFFTLLKAVHNYEGLTGQLTPQMKQWFERRKNKSKQRLTVVKGSKEQT